MILTVHVRPNARENRVVEWLDATTVKVAVSALPEKGRANEAVIDLLSKTLRIPRSSVHLVRGSTTRMKHFSVPDNIRI